MIETNPVRKDRESVYGLALIHFPSASEPGRWTSDDPLGTSVHVWRMSRVLPCVACGMHVWHVWHVSNVVPPPTFQPKGSQDLAAKPWVLRPLFKLVGLTVTFRTKGGLVVIF